MTAEKKKLFIIGVLALVILCVGVFQFTGGSKPEVPAAKAKAHKTIAPRKPVETPAAAISNAFGSGQPVATPPPVEPGQPGGETAMLDQNVGERDPFDGSKYAPVDTKKQNTPANLAPAAAPAPKKLAKIPPLQITGDELGGTKINLPNAKPKDEFDYSVSGVITGEKPAAIFSDAKGNQRLVQLGGSLDGDTKVISIERGKVTVNYHGTDRTLTVGASNPTEKRSDEK